VGAPLVPDDLLKLQIFLVAYDTGTYLDHIDKGQLPRPEGRSLR
jgi:hypothetical protein